MRKQFQLSPAHVHFGHVEMGQLKVKTCILTNISPDLGRFFIKPVNAPLSLKYKSGALPAGMAVRIEVSAHHQSHLLDNAQHDGGCISSRLTSS